MDAVLGVLSTIGEIFRMVSGVTSGIMDALRGFGSYIFLAGFFGILLASLWFIFRYIDKQKLTAPAVFFALFFAMLLSGNLLMLSSESKSLEAAAQSVGVETQAEAVDSASDTDTHV